MKLPALAPLLQKVTEKTSDYFQVNFLHYSSAIERRSLGATSPLKQRQVGG